MKITPIIVQIALILYFLYPSKADPCVVWDDSPLFYDLISPHFGIKLPTTYIDSYNYTQSRGMRNCTLTDIDNANPNITIEITDPKSITGILLNDTILQTWLTILQNGIVNPCASPSTNTISIICKSVSNAITVTQPLRNSITSVVWPYLDNPDYMGENGKAKYLNSTLFGWINSTMNIPSSNFTYGTYFLKSSTQFSALSSFWETSTLNYAWTSGGIGLGWSKHHHEFKDNIIGIKDVIMKPISYSWSVLSHPLADEAVLDLIDDIRQVKDKHSMNGYVDDFLYSLSDVRTSYVQNGSSLDQVRSIIQSINDVDFRKTELYNIRLFDPTEMTSNWNNPADPKRVVSVTNLRDLYNIAGTVVSWIGHINGKFNASGCLQDGAPWLMIPTLICRYPIFLLIQAVSIFAVGFDPNNPQCDSYLDPLVYIPSSLKVLSSITTFDQWLDEHDGYKAIPLMDFIVYNYQSTNHTLPPNMIPCTLVAPAAQLITISIIVGIIAVLGVFLQVSLRTSKKVFGDSDGILSKSMPTAITVVSATMVPMNLSSQ